MADTALADMTDGSTAQATDIIYAVRDPGGTPLDRKLTIDNVRAYLLAQANTWTAAQTIASGTLTASAPAANITQTWNNSGVTFTAADINITDTASASASLLQNWRVGGVSKFSIDKSGNIIAAGSIRVGTDSGKGLINYTSNTMTFVPHGAAALTISNGGATFGAWSGTTTLVQGPSAGNGNLNRAATGLTIATGTNTGSGAGADIVLATVAPGTSGTSENTATEKVRVTGKGNLVVGTAALATNATDGFVHVPSSAGAPTGAPTAYTGTVPFQIDTTNSMLYAYIGGTWKSVALT